MLCTTAQELINELKKVPAETSIDFEHGVEVKYDHEQNTVYVYEVG